MHFGLLTAFIMLVAMAAALVLAPVVPSSTRVMRRWSASAIVEGGPDRPVILGGHRGPALQSDGDDRTGRRTPSLGRTTRRNSVRSGPNRNRRHNFVHDRCDATAV